MALPGYLEDTAKDYAKQATAAYSVPIDTGTFTGRQFVAGEDPLQTSAIARAQTGIGSYEPYLQAAQANLTSAGTAAGGLGALTGPTAYQSFMSPYQQDVIDTSLAAFDKQAAQQQQLLRDQSIDSGNFGVCIICGDLILEARMMEVPNATKCVDCKTKNKLNIK